MALVKLLLVYATALLGAGLVVTLAYTPAAEYVRRKTSATADQLMDLFIWVPRHRLLLTFCVSPIICFLVGWMLMHNIFVAIAAGAAGLLLPQQITSFLKAQRIKKFNSQLVDALMNLSSSMKAGLSIPQGLEVIVEEMPQPISQEFGLVVKENKMGIMLNEALERMKQRVPSDDLTLVVTALLIARETGGDVTQVFSQLVQTIRDRRKLREKLATLTLQAKLQGAVLSSLPIIFAFFANSTHPGYFKVFFETPTGHLFLTIAIVGEIIGVFLIWRFSRMPLSMR